MSAFYPSITIKRKTFDEQTIYEQRWLPVLTCGGPDGGGDSGGAHWGDAVVILGVARLNGPQVTVAPGAEAARQVQGLHGLRLHLAEHRLAHRLELTVDLCLAHLCGTAVSFMRRSWVMATGVLAGEASHWLPFNHGSSMVFLVLFTYLNQRISKERATTEDTQCSCHRKVPSQGLFRQSQ